MHPEDLVFPNPFFKPWNAMTLQQINGQKCHKWRKCVDFNKVANFLLYLPCSVYSRTFPYFFLSFLLIPQNLFPLSGWFRFLLSMDVFSIFLEPIPGQEQNMEWGYGTWNSFQVARSIPEQEFANFTFAFRTGSIAGAIQISLYMARKCSYRQLFVPPSQALNVAYTQYVL